MFGGNFAPAGWMFCQGQLLPISEYETLFNLIGTTFGGDGQSTFALPDLRGRLPIHQGSGFTLAQSGGAETVTLTVSQIPAHTHVASVQSGGGSSSSPSGAVWAGANVNQYSTNNSNVSMNAGISGPAEAACPIPISCLIFASALSSRFSGFSLRLLRPN